MCLFYFVTTLLVNNFATNKYVYKLIIENMSKQGPSCLIWSSEDKALFNQMKKDYGIGTSEVTEVNGVPITEDRLVNAMNAVAGELKDRNKNPTYDMVNNKLMQFMTSNNDAVQVKMAYKANFVSVTNYTRSEAVNNPGSLYIFTDNTDRSSGNNAINEQSAYYKKYNDGSNSAMFYPNTTTAVVRGLDNAYPISTQHYYHGNAKGVRGRWTDDDIDEFKQVVQGEIDDIINAWNSGKYTRIVFPKGGPEGLFNSRISNITKERTPKLYAFLHEQLGRLGQIDKVKEKPMSIGKIRDEYKKIQIHLVGSNYHARTLYNINNSDYTLAFATDFTPPGERLTKSNAGRNYEGIQLIKENGKWTYDKNALKNAAEHIAKGGKTKTNLQRNGDNLIINIAGNSIDILDNSSITQDQADDIIREALTDLMHQLEGTTVKGVDIISGGQTGIDEAGVKAASVLGLHADINASKNLAFRLKNGNDVFNNQQAFRARFTGEDYQIQDQVQKEKKEAVDNSRFTRRVDTTKISSFDQDKQLYEDYPNPQERRDDAIHIARLFSKEIDHAVNEWQNELQEKISKGEETKESGKKTAETQNEAIYRQLEQARNPERIAQLRAELNAVDRISAINKYTPWGIFQRLKQRVYDDFLGMSEEQQLDYVKKEIIEKGWAEATDDDFEDYARERRDAMVTWYRRIDANFLNLAEEAASYIKQREHIIVDPSYIEVMNSLDKANDMSEGQDEDNSEASANDTDFQMEQAYKDGWMNTKWDTSVQDSLSADIREYISNIPRMVKEDGEYYVDQDYQGNVRYLDGSYVAITLMDALDKMCDSEDFDRALEGLRDEYYFVNDIIEDLNKPENAQLKASFFQNFNKEFQTFAVQSKKDGKWTSKVINRPEGTNYLLDQWRANYESGTQFNKESIYNRDGTLNIENATNLLSQLDQLFRDIQANSREAFTDDINLDRLSTILDSMGMNMDKDLLRRALLNTTGLAAFTPPALIIIPSMQTILTAISQRKVQDIKRKDGTIRRADIFNFSSGTYKLGTAYNNIASQLSYVDETAMESSVRENGKSYYAHSNPSMFGTMIKRLTNSMAKTEQEYQDWMQNEYGQYEWFNKNGHYMNYWLKMLKEHPELRKQLKSKVVLNQGKVEYLNWDNVDTITALLTEYNSDPNGGYAYYQGPILSDITSCNLIRFRRFTRSNIKNETKDDGTKYTSLDEFFTDRFIDLILQEYNRIQVVRERAHKYFDEGDHSFQLAPNYDMIKKKDADGNWIVDKIGGAEFKFMPILNSMGVLEHLDELNGSDAVSSSDNIREYLTELLQGTTGNNGVLATLYDNMMDKYEKMGLLDMDDQHKNYLSLDITDTSNQNMTALMSNLNQWYSDMSEEDRKSLNYSKFKKIYDRYNNYNYIRYTDRSALRSMAVAAQLDTDIVDGYRSNVDNFFREYHLNTSFAQSQIIQIMSTDIAYYKNLTDFYKRNKQTHSSGLRMYTDAQFYNEDTGKIEKIGKQTQKVIYLRDNYIISTMLDDLNTILNQKVQKGTLTKVQKDYIMSQFANINVTDGQAYRTLDSYRSVLGMSGRWDMPQERAYSRIKTGNWNMEDFNTVWQTLKPFNYSMNAMDSHTEHGNIKMSTQHKNSEFLLLAGYQMIAANLKNSRLAQLQRFLEDNHIDAVMFESAVKEGGYGVINLDIDETKMVDGKNYDDYFKEQMDRAKRGEITYKQVTESMQPFMIGNQDVYKRLSDVTGITSGNPNPEIIHELPFRDYMIQTPTPEHGIDAEVLFPTQIRKMIDANFPPTAKFKLGNKELTRDELINRYDNTIVANIVQKFMQVYNIFQDPKKVEQVLLDEIKGNNRYSNDLAKAVTLDNEGNFTMPLFESTNLDKVSALLNSVLKNRITKQKIKGGSFIQVSNYGLTNDLNIVYDTLPDGTKHIKYMEVYMPAYSKQFFAPLLDKDGNLDIDKLPEELRRGIGVRIPTEAKYSMVPLRIKGFLPQQNGTAIMLPSDITTMAGSDFD